MKTPAQSKLELRPATFADVEMVADLESERAPDDPRDPAMLAFWWTVRPPDLAFIRMLAERDGAAAAYLYGSHQPWSRMPKRFSTMRFVLHPEIWTEALYEQLVEVGESWVRSEEGAVGVVSVRADFKSEISVLERMGYREERRARQWELDLVANRESLLAAASRSREHMASQGVSILTLDRDTDPEKLRKLYELSIEAEHDIPTTIPAIDRTYDEWHHLSFDNPGTHPDRIWIAREGDAIVGLSMIEYPPIRGFAWTAFTATSRSVRGRGIARALKYETVAQAIALGAGRVRTNNDGQNAPILHINAEMGYVAVEPVVELHRKLLA